MSEFQSYLNNDGIDDLTPLARKHKVSNLSLTDLNQWKSNSSMVQLSRNSLIIKRKRKTIIDHPRVASYAFCFDIDGVILRGPTTIPVAAAALKMLNGDNKYNITVPSIYVTNGGGKFEETRAKDLSARLECNITADQIIQGHTPMKDLTSVYENVLVVGGVGNVCRDVAKSYGFKNVYTPLDILAWNPAVSPYHDLTEEEKACIQKADFSKFDINAIMIFADSRNWAADLQIILELLLSVNGRMGTQSKTYDQGPQIYFAHSDFIWATDYNLSRYGMGALQVTTAALYREHTGKELKVNRFGKPQPGTFKYAEKILKQWRTNVLQKQLKNDGIKKLSGGPSADALVDKETLDKSIDQSIDTERSKDVEKVGSLEELPPASTVYFVGDTPESDIRFANAHDATWHSILVETGVYQPGTVPKYPPKHTCANVLEAVEYAIEREHEKELLEWNETAEDDEVDKSMRLNFADLMMTPSQTNLTESARPKDTNSSSSSRLNTLSSSNRVSNLSLSKLNVINPMEAADSQEIPPELLASLAKLGDLK